MSVLLYCRTSCLAFWCSIDEVIYMLVRFEPGTGQAALRFQAILRAIGRCYKTLCASAPVSVSISAFAAGSAPVPAYRSGYSSASGLIFEIAAMRICIIRISEYRFRARLTHFLSGLSCCLSRQRKSVIDLTSLFFTSFVPLLVWRTYVVCPCFMSSATGRFRT
jgi:hypothetical protein